MQFIYGDDGLNPAFMEDNKRSVDFKRLHLNVTELYSCPSDSFLDDDEFLALVNTKLMQSHY